MIKHGAILFLLAALIFLTWVGCKKGSLGVALVTAASLDTSDPNGLYQLMLDQHSITLADGDEFYYPTASNTSVTAAGFLSSDLSTVDFIIIDRTGANTAYPVTWTNSSASDGSAKRFAAN